MEKLMRSLPLIFLSACTATPPTDLSTTQEFQPGSIDGANIPIDHDEERPITPGCNGWDDDADGAVDEADELTASEVDDVSSCTTIVGGAGTWNCVSGAWRCTACAPTGTTLELGDDCPLTVGNLGTTWCTAGGDVQCSCIAGECSRDIGN